MLDERWSSDTREFAAMLRETLAKACPPQKVRAIEADPAGPAAAQLAADLRQIGLNDLPPDPELQAAAAFELGYAGAIPLKLTASTDSVLIPVAQIAGAAERALDLAVEYARDRRQFGVPIGSFQAVAHRLVDTRIAVDGLTLLVRKVAWMGEPDDFWTAALISAAVPRAFTVARNTHQVFGGHGFTVEADLQLWTRRLRAWARALPQDAVQARLAIARQLLADPDSDQVRNLWHNERGLSLPRWAVELDAGVGA